MNETQALGYIHSLERFGIKPGLGRVRMLCAALGNPQDKLAFIHVAGTNGKGSTATMLAEMCMAAGFKTGLYTSPYVVNFRERMRVDGEMIPASDLCRWTETLHGIAETLPEPVTEFEFVTALAFAWFAGQGCQRVVLEVGLGGRWDATNIIAAPLCSVITKISLDHTQVLGDTIAQIAGEKCGIVKPGCPVVSYCAQPEEALAVIRATCEERGCALALADETRLQVLSGDISGSDAIIDGLRLRVPLPGRHMCRNALTAVTAARLLNLPDAAIQVGAANTKIAARMEVLAHEPLVLLDGGHNPDGARALAAALAEYLPGQRLCAVCGMMADKDAVEYLRALRPFIAHLITCRPDNPRALNAWQLAELARQAGYDKITPAASVEQALRTADRPLLICGSFYLAGEVRAAFV